MSYARFPCPLACSLAWQLLPGVGVLLGSPSADTPARASLSEKGPVRAVACAAEGRGPACVPVPWLCVCPVAWGGHSVSPWTGPPRGGPWLSPSVSSQAHGQTFTFPDLFPKGKQPGGSSADEDLRDQVLEEQRQRQSPDPRRGGVPSWFGL